jgi:signal transduction histidine kinase
MRRPMNLSVQRLLGGHRLDDAWTVRVDLIARAFSLLAGFTVAATTGQVGDAAGVALLLIAIATLMTWWAVVIGPGSQTYLIALVVEAVFTLFLVALSTQAADPYVIYLAAPAFLAGLRGGLPIIFVMLACELLTVIVIEAQQATMRSDYLETAGPWILTGWAFGLLGAWIRELRKSQRDLRSSPYAYTHRLLAQLRTITQGLPGGLDVGAIAEDVLSLTMEQTEAARAAVVLIYEHEGYVVVAHRNWTGATLGIPDDPTVKASLATQQPVQHVLNQRSDAAAVHRLSLPLIVGHRSIGVVLVDSSEAVADPQLTALADMTNEAALRLESAVLFNDVRSLATVEERQRLAREIHDGVAQEIGALGYLVDDLARDQCDQHHQQGLQDLRVELTRVVSDLRLSIFDLRSGVSSNAGLGSVLGDYVREIGRQSGMTVHLSLEESPNRLRLDVETELLRIAQEAVNNARKHSQAENLWVTCRVEPPFAEIRVEDDGIGDANPAEGHYGLLSMQERADRVHAVLSVSERPGGGTAVSVVLLPPATHATPHQTGESNVLQRSARR